ncbi:MAG: hypothetical protein ACI4DU_10775 [Lachnospiraceae bacterium]
MRIGSISGYGGIDSVYGMQSTARYSVSSVHGNPKSLQPVSGINQESEPSKPLAILKKDQEASQYIRERDYNQSMTAAEDYLSVMQEMMQGRDPQSLFAQMDDNAMDAAGSPGIDLISNRAETEAFVQEPEGDVQADAQNNMRQNGSVNPYQFQRAMEAYQMA